MPDLHFVEAVKGVVIDPSIGSVLPLFLFSFLNDLVGIFPFALALAGQLIFLKGAFTLALSAKLLVFVAVPVGLGSAFGSLPLYALAYFGGKPAINKWHRFFRFSWQDVERVSQYFKGSWYDEIIFLLGVVRKLSNYAASRKYTMPAEIAAGLVKDLWNKPNYMDFLLSARAICY